MTEQLGATFHAGFEFARRLRDQDFLAYLKISGWQSGDHVIIAADDEPVIDVINRLSLHRTGGRAVIAISDPLVRFAFKLLIAEQVRRRYFWRRADSIDLGPGASIGMLYSLISPAGEYVPSQWTRKLRFEKVPATA